MTTIEKDLRSFRDVIGESFEAVPPASFMEAYKIADTRYVQACTDKIMQAHALPEDIERFVYHCVYLANQYTNKEKEKAKHEKMLADGWTLITLSSWAEIPEGKALLSIDSTDEMFGSVCEKTGKFFMDETPHGKHPFFIPKGNRRRGYDAYNLIARVKGAYYKMLVN